MKQWNPYAPQRILNHLPLWVIAGIFGGISGGLAVAWLLWGRPHLLSSALCFLVKIGASGLLWLIACAGGCSFILTTHNLIKAIRQLTRPASIYEPVEPIPELEILSWPHPGCGLLIYAPLLGLTAAVSLPWFYLSLRQVPLIFALLSAFLGITGGLLLMHGEAKAGRL